VPVFKSVGHGEKTRYYIDGVQVSREEFDQALPDQPLEAAPGGHLPSCWPQVMESLGVHPSQVAQANERNRKAGVNVTYDRDGNAVVPDRNERRKLIRLERCHDKDGGYGD
jgi:hypothetical protein